MRRDCIMRELLLRGLLLTSTEAKKLELCPGRLIPPGPGKSSRGVEPMNLAYLGYNSWSVVNRTIRYAGFTRLLVFGLLGTLLAIPVYKGESSSSSWGSGGTAIMVKARKGQKISVFDGKVELTVREIQDRGAAVGFWMSTDVRIASQPPLTIEGGVGSTFWDKARTVEITITDLNERVATFRLVSLKS